MKNKLFRYKQTSEFENVMEYNKPGMKVELRSLLNKQNRIVLELGCGKGEYTVSLAENEPETLFVGVDIKGDRIYKGAKLALEKKLKNVLFVRMQVDHLTEFFEKDFIDEIWITFPDPYPKDRTEKKRLTFSRFLEYYKLILKSDGFAHLKTDNTELFEFSVNSVKDFGCEIFEINRDLYMNGEPHYPLNVETYYEKKHKSLGEKIKYLKFGFLN